MELCLSLMSTPDSSSFLALFSTQLNNTCFLHTCSPFQFSTILFSIHFLMFFSSCISSTLAYCRLITVIWSIATSYNFCKAIPIWRTIINTCITHIYKCNIIIHLYKNKLWIIHKAHKQLLWQWNSNINKITRKLSNLSSSCVLPQVPLVAAHLVQQVEHISSLNERKTSSWIALKLTKHL